MRDENIYFFIGTTAELIKLAPVLQELKKRKKTFKIISSNQNILHFEELRYILGKQEIYYKNVLKHTRMPNNLYLRFVVWAIKTLGNFHLYFNNEFRNIDKRNSFFIVHGDTVSSLIGAIAAKIQGLRLVHIESGLRSFNFLEPFPEELCRFIISRLASIHFCPNSWSVKNLKKIGRVKINTLNNTLIETLQTTLRNTKDSIIRIIPKTKYFILVLHRQEHILFRKNFTKRIIKIFSEYTSSNLVCVLVLHKLTSDFMKKEGLWKEIRKNRNFVFVPRLPYSQFITLMAKAEFIATDGGSNQEEAYYLGKPCLILRNVTERIEGLGENALLSHANEQIIRDFVKNYKKYQRRSISYTIPPSKIIVDYLLKLN
ncbi:UDP-N-acetylglucosamine 2-epimerase [Candidatus Daviesbacteria bacterium]|nr:UDP-N-acetylglucosamine 2-epimerase [Candidatus Daviesbacteria bacterium]